MSKTKTRPPQDTSTLAESAMLVNLTIRMWQGKKTDRRATRELHQTHQASERAGDYRKRLLGECGALKTVHDIAGEANRRHRELTLPWFDDGLRIIAAPGILNYQKVVGDYKRDFNHAWKDFVQQYPDLTMAARKDLGTLFTVEEYPSQRELAEKFGFEYSLMLLPRVEDFRVNMRESEAANIKEQMQADLQTALGKAMGDAYGRAAQVVEHMVERLRAYKYTEKGLVGKFHDTLLSNIEDVAKMLPMLNIMGSGGQQLIDLSNRLQSELLTYSAQDLRDSKVRRQETVKKGEDILKAIRAVAA